MMRYSWEEMYKSGKNLKQISILSGCSGKIRARLLGTISKRKEDGGKLNMIEDPLESLETTLAFSARDMGETTQDAWIYGIIIGWDLPSLRELQKKLKWSDANTQRLRRLHKEFKMIKKERMKAKKEMNKVNI